MISMRSIVVFIGVFGGSQGFFFGGGSSCGCQQQPSCPPPPPAPSCGGGGGFAAPLPQASQPYFGSSAYVKPTYGNGIVLQREYAPLASQAVAPQAQPILAPIGEYTMPIKRHTVRKEDRFETGVDQEEGYRVKRASEDLFDPKCNSDDLKTVILNNINENTATAKRQIQSAAADALGGRVDVICSKGTFSYIVNTELYCETQKDGITCLAFKQSS